jgi:DnaJ-class molecular chaperone
MGLIQAFNQWKTTRYENHLAQMREENKCPECYGRGFVVYPAQEFVYYSNPLDCPGCNGTGLYTEWSKLIK